MKIKIVKAEDSWLWYSNKIGKEFEVSGETEEYYEVNNGDHFVIKSDCEIVKDETFVKEGDKLVCISDKYKEDDLYPGGIYEVNYAEDHFFTVRESSGRWTNPIEIWSVFKRYEEPSKQFKIGDIVKIVRVVYDASIRWVSSMTYSVGKIVEIIRVDTDGFTFIEEDGSESYWFPFECAELVATKPKSEKYYTGQIDDFKIFRDGISEAPRYTPQYMDHNKNFVLETKRCKGKFTDPFITQAFLRPKKKHIKFN